MGFFDNAINKTKEVFDVACKKTDEVVTVEIVKDSTDISDEARNLVDAIKEKQDEIDRLNKDIQDIKNKRVCPNCNANIDVNSVYCNNCGAKVTVDSEQ